MATKHAFEAERLALPARFSNAGEVRGPTSTADRNVPVSMEEALDLECLDMNMFRSKMLWKPLKGKGVFGGQGMGQAAWAAVNTVPSHFRLHALHCNFMGMGDTSIPILYHVERLKDGKNFCVRFVKALQHGRSIFSVTCSFQVPEPNLPNHQLSIFLDPATRRITPVQRSPSNTDSESFATVPKPEDCLPNEERYLQALENTADLPQETKDYVHLYAFERAQSAIEIRSADLVDGDSLLKREGPSQSAWFRSRTPLRDDPDFQKCVIAFASDFSLIDTIAKALGISASARPLLASLTHSMYFYDDTIDAADWLLYHMWASRAAYGRGFVNGRIYKRDGTLSVMITQEGVVRAQKAKI